MIATIEKEVEQLTLEDTILLVEELWDSIAEKSNEIPLTQWQQTELDTRLQEYTPQSKTRSYSAVHEEIRKSLI